jgi:hypothetical protein
MRATDMIAALLALSALVPGSTQAACTRRPARRIEIDLSEAGKPVGRFFDLSVGSD